jgi:hypothetical protein
MERYILLYVDSESLIGLVSIEHPNWLFAVTRRIKNLPGFRLKDICYNASPPAQICILQTRYSLFTVSPNMSIAMLEYKSRFQSMYKNSPSKYKSGYI